MMNYMSYASYLNLSNVESVLDGEIKFKKIEKNHGV